MKVRMPILVVVVLALILAVSFNMAFFSALIAFLIGLSVYDRVPKSWIEALNRKL